MTNKGTVVRRTPSGLPALAFRPGGDYLITLGGPTGAAAPAKGNPNESPVKHLDSTASALESLGAYTDHWVPWGLTDDHPRKVVELIRRSTVGKSGLQRLTKAIYGQRLFTYKISGYDIDGTPTMKHVPIPEWEEITRRSNFNLVRLALTQDYNYFGINFPELRFNGNKEKVYGIDYQKASHTRMALMDPATGFIPEVYVSGRFPNVKINVPADKQDLAIAQTIPCIDFIRYPDQMDDIRKDYEHFKYIMPQYWPDTLNDYYPEVYWYSAKDHLEIATSIPIFKKNVFKHQMSLKYEIQIPFEYFYELYPNFKGMSESQQDQIVDDLYDDIIKNLTGAENAAKAIMSFYKTGTDGKPVGQWVIKAIDDKWKNDMWLPDASASNSEIQFAMMINPAVTGQGNTGGNYTGGSNNGGSNIRESGLDMRSLLQADRDITLSYFNFCRDYNGWDPEVQIGVQDMVLTTLDTGAGTAATLS